MEVLLRTRETVLEILADDSRPVNESLALALLYGYQAQAELDGDAEQPFDGNCALESVREYVKLPESLTYVSGSAFSECTNLMTLILSDSITHIGEFAFLGCDNIVIRAPLNSYAEEYADDNSIPFIPIT